MIGKDIEYSFSRAYFNNKFKRLGLNELEYINFDLDEISECRAVLSRTDVRGLNVTIPYKTAIIPYLDRLDPLARSIGAVNTISLVTEEAIGYNTDTIGFEGSLRPLLLPYDRIALVLGTGGASRAVLHALKGLGLETVWVSRNAGPGRITYSEIDAELMKQCTVIVNTTPLGGSNFPGQVPDMPYEWLTSRHLLYDLSYKPERTAFLIEGIRRGCRIKNGHEMLVLQAEASWAIWNTPNP